MGYCGKCGQHYNCHYSEHDEECDGGKPTIEPNSQEDFEMSKIDKLLGMFVLSRGIKKDSLSNPIEAHTFYDLTYEDEKWTVVKHGTVVIKKDKIKYN